MPQATTSAEKSSRKRKNAAAPPPASDRQTRTRRANESPVPAQTYALDINAEDPPERPIKRLRPRRRVQQTNGKGLEDIAEEEVGGGEGEEQMQSGVFSPTKNTETVARILLGMGQVAPGMSQTNEEPTIGRVSQVSSEDCATHRGTGRFVAAGDPISALGFCYKYRRTKSSKETYCVCVSCIYRYTLFRLRPDCPSCNLANPPSLHIASLIQEDKPTSEESEIEQSEYNTSYSEPEDSPKRLSKAARKKAVSNSGRAKNTLTSPPCLEVQYQLTPRGESASKIVKMTSETSYDEFLQSILMEMAIPVHKREGRRLGIKMPDKRVSDPPIRLTEDQYKATLKALYENALALDQGKRVNRKIPTVIDLKVRCSKPDRELFVGHSLAKHAL